MAEEIKVGCARPIGGPVGEKVDVKNETSQQPTGKEIKAMVTEGKKSSGLFRPGLSKGQVHLSAVV